MKLIIGLLFISSLAIANGIQDNVPPAKHLPPQTPAPSTQDLDMQREEADEGKMHKEYGGLDGLPTTKRKNRIPNQEATRHKR